MVLQKDTPFLTPQEKEEHFATDFAIQKENNELTDNEDEDLAKLREEVYSAYNALNEFVMDEIETINIKEVMENCSIENIVEESLVSTHDLQNKKLDQTENELMQSQNSDNEEYCPTEHSEDSVSAESEASEREDLKETDDPKRKRKPEMQSWNREQNKLKRQKGDHYKGVRKTDEGKWVADNERAERKLKAPCSCKLSAQKTKLQCRQFSEADRTKIFEHFWKEMTWPERKVFIHTLVDVVTTKNHKNQVHEISHRNNTLIYHLKKEGIRLRVCRTMLLNTLAIGSWSLQNWSKMGKEQMEQTHVQPERKSKRLSQEKSSLRNFLQGLPKMESHYCRASSQKMYLEPIWQSKMALFNQYKKYCEEKAYNPLSIKVFHDEFSALNLSLFRPKKDQCDLCISFKAGNSAEEVFKKHIERKHAAREEKTKDKENAIHVFTMDLQSTLLSPMLKASAIYYKKKLVVHNFTLYNLKTKDGYCFIWNEVEGGVTANEFSSIIYYFLETKATILPGEEVILYSDGCSYQNRNVTLSNALLHLASSKNITIIQKYLVSGHTQMECDSMHSCIERRLRNREVYSPACYISAAKEARMNPKPFEVEYLCHTFFKNFSGLKYYQSIRPGSKPGDPVVTNLCALQYTPDLQIKYKLDFSSEWKILERRTRRQNSSGQIDFLYKKQIPIKKSKYDHLQQLKDVIPSDHHLFYDTLPFVSD